ncbi:hypothetical protein BDA96_08G144700 [Sorghum bicolor]|uniref:Myb/SANT-like domain-containing protein n=1 Tax=Sorghum bicolor TaxID=4558 RepID=A0A921QI59_SORBI|nr:hypothetical protein BDA96_08G144700 [Sorghum bicolor]
MFVTTVPFQIHPRDCSSSSSPHSRQQRMVHKWSCDEDVAYLDEVQTVLQGKRWTRPKNDLHQMIAVRLNTRFNVMNFDFKIIKEKYYAFRNQWKTMTIIDPNRKLVTSKGRPISGHEETIKLLFSGDVGTSSGTPGSGKTAFPVNGVEVTVSGPMGSGGAPNSMLTPEQAAAVAYLSVGNGEKNSQGKEMLIFTEMLCNVPFLLPTFHAMCDDYVMRRNHLIDVFVS